MSVENGPSLLDKWCLQGKSNPSNSFKLLNKSSVSQLAELSNLSKSHIPQVKGGKRPPSKKLLRALEQGNSAGNRRRSQGDAHRAIELFLESRRGESLREQWGSIANTSAKRFRTILPVTFLYLMESLLRSFSNFLLFISQRFDKRLYRSCIPYVP